MDRKYHQHRGHQKQRGNEAASDQRSFSRLAPPPSHSGRPPPILIPLKTSRFNPATPGCSCSSIPLQPSHHISGIPSITYTIPKEDTAHPQDLSSSPLLSLELSRHSLIGAFLPYCHLGLAFVAALLDSHSVASPCLTLQTTTWTHILTLDLHRTRRIRRRSHERSTA